MLTTITQKYDITDWVWIISNLTLLYFKPDNLTHFRYYSGRPGGLQHASFPLHPLPSHPHFPAERRLERRGYQTRHPEDGTDNQSSQPLYPSRPREHLPETLPLLLHQTPGLLPPHLIHHLPQRGDKTYPVCLQLHSFLPRKVPSPLLPSDQTRDVSSSFLPPRPAAHIGSYYVWATNLHRLLSHS